MPPHDSSGGPVGVPREVWIRVLWIGLAAVILRVLYLWTYAKSLPFIDQPVLDAAYYDAWARSILSGHLFPDGPFYQAPGYPAFLALVYKILGPEPRHAVWAQAFLGVATTLATVLIAALLFGRHEALLAGLLMLGAGSLYFFESKLLVESWALFLLTSSVLLLLWADRGLPVPRTREERARLERAVAEGRRPPEPRGRALAAALGAGLLAGMASVTRPNLIVIPGLFVVIGLWRALGRRRPWSTTLLYAAAFALALLPTTVHNVRHGALAQVVTSGGLNFYIGNHLGSRGIYEDVPGFSGVIATQEAEADSLVVADLGQTLPPGQESGYWVSRTVREIGQDFTGWLGLLARKAWLFVNRQEEDNNGSPALEAAHVIWLRLLALPFNFFVAAGAIGLALALGRGRAGRGARGDLTLPVLVLAGIFLTALFFFVMARLRLAALPMLAVFSAHALARADLAWRSGARKPVAALVTAGLLFLVISWRSPLGPARSAQWESQLFFETGRGLAAKKRNEEAATAFQQAVAIDPKNVDAWIHLGQMALENRDLAGAVVDFEKARDADLQNFAVRNNLGILYYQAQRFDAAERELVQAIRLRPDAAGPYFYRGLVARELGDPDTAEKHFREALDRDPYFTGAYVRLIENLLDSGRLAEARVLADQAGQRAVALPPGLAARLR